jgi:hypothetical protein
MLVNSSGNSGWERSADRGVFLGRLGALTQVIFAVLIGGLSIFHPEPGFVPRGLVVMTAFAMPGLIGLVGVNRHARAVCLAAGVTSAIGSVVAFSGVTLIFLVPAAMLVVTGLQLSPGRHPEATRRAGLASGIAATLIVTLLIAGGAVGLLVNDAGCWIVHETASGDRVEAMPYSTGEMTLPPDASSGGCTTGLISARGAGLLVALDGIALLLALAAPGSSRPRGLSRPAAG